MGGLEVNQEGDYYPPTFNAGQNSLSGKRVYPALARWPQLGDTSTILLDSIAATSTDLECPEAAARAAVAKIIGYVFITLPINCSNDGYPCSGSRSGCIFSQM